MNNSALHRFERNTWSLNRIKKSVESLWRQLFVLIIINTKLIGSHRLFHSDQIGDFLCSPWDLQFNSFKKWNPSFTNQRVLIHLLDISNSIFWFQCICFAYITNWHLVKVKVSSEGHNGTTSTGSTYIAPEATACSKTNLFIPNLVETQSKSVRTSLSGNELELFYAISIFRRIE